jgi:hypothetical protein
VKARLILGYHGSGRRYGIIPFGNGVTLRLWRLALHIWSPTPQ